MQSIPQNVLQGSHSIPFDELVERATQGDQEAAESLLDGYSEFIAREVRTQRRFESLKSLVDVEDIAQSVWRCFFGSLKQGALVFRDCRDLAAYLATVTRNRIDSQLRKHLADKRDVRRTVNSHDFETAADSHSNPSYSISTMEFLQQVMRQMTPEERMVATRRASGSTWEELAAEMGTTPEALRKRHTRTAARLLSELEAKDDPK